MSTSELRSPPRSHGPGRLFSMVAVAASAAMFVACGGADESGIDQIVESQTSEDVDVGDDGVTIEPDDDGITADEDGLSVETDDGGITVDEDGSFVITDENGETITGNAGSEDGDYAIETDDGDFRVDASGEVPDEWPEAIPHPEGITGATASVQTLGDGQLGISFTGTAGDDFVGDFSAALEDAGFEQLSDFESGDNVTRIYEDDSWTITVSSYDLGGDAQTAVTVYSK